MSSDVITEIVNLLRKHANISVKFAISTVKNGTLLTTIHLKESTGHQNISKRTVKNKKKSPSRIARDQMRHEAFLSRKAGSGDKDSSAAVLLPSTTQCSNTTATLRRTVKASRRLGSVIGSAGYEDNGAGWVPEVGVGDSHLSLDTIIPQLDGDGESEGNEEDEEDEGNEEDDEDEEDEEGEEDESDESEDKNKHCTHTFEKNVFYTNPKLNAITCDVCWILVSSDPEEMDLSVSYGCDLCDYDECEDCYSKHHIPIK